jgi:predicted membrane-bound spermidine synthase
VTETDAAEPPLASAAAFAFAGSGCLLVLEIVAGRLIAPTVGVSLYTWTSVIGVVLGGVSLGNYLGGRIADRRPNRSALAVLYLAGAGASLAVLAAVRYASSLELPHSAPAFLQVLWLTAVLFLVPSTVLAMPTPLLTRLALPSVERAGRVVGRIQAAAALGSIAGTFLTGFLLISWIGTRHILAGIAGTLLVLAVLARPPWLRGRVFELGSFAALIAASGWVSHSPCLRESNYYCIRVTSGLQGGTPARFLNLDRLLDSIIDVAHPANLLYPYELDYAAAIRRVHPAGDSIDTLMLGGGAYSFPRYLEQTYRGRIVVAEIDPAVTSVARKYLGLRDSPRLRIVHDDARRVLRGMPAGERFDLVLGDTFNDFQVPYHLTTRQFHELLARHLKPGGLYLLNLVDGLHFDFLRSEIRTLRLTFPYVGLIAEPGSLQTTTRFTFVVVAANTAPAQALPTIPQADLDSFLAGGHSVVLTDDHVPVDQLLAPVFGQLLEGHG